MFHDPEIIERIKNGYTPLCQADAWPQEIDGYVKTREEAIAFYEHKFDYLCVGVDERIIEVEDPNGYYGSHYKYSLVYVWNPVLEEES